MSSTPTLSAPGLILRPLVATDAPALFVALSDPEVQLYRRQAAHASMVETDDYISQTLAKSRAAWAITIDGREALGRLALRVPVDGVGELGIVIRAIAQKRGLGIGSLALVTAFAFGDLQLDTLHANIDTENLASRALFARAGFDETEVLTNDRTTKLGRRDSILMVKHRQAG